MAAWKEALCRRLETQATRIEEVLGQLGLSAVVTGGVVGTSFVLFRVHILGGQLTSRLDSVEGTLAAVLDKPQIKIHCRENLMIVNVMELPETDQRQQHSSNLLELVSSAGDIRPLTILFGTSKDGRPLLLHTQTADFSNILVVGREGAGKTTLLRAMLYSLAARNKQHQFQAVVIDFNPAGQMVASSDNTSPGSGPLAAFSHLPHLVEPVATSLPQASQALDFMVKEMQYRQNHDISHPKILLVVDNLDQLLTAGQRPLTNRFIHLLQFGAEVGIHLVLSLEYPGGTYMDKILKCGFSLRFIGRVENEKLARAAAGVSDTGAESLNGQGDFIAVHAGQAIRFQTAHIGDYDLYLAVEKLSRQKRKQMVARTAEFRVGLAGAGR